jgi:molecular chaperone DnaK
LRRLLTRAELEAMTDDLVTRTIDLCALTLEESGLDKDDIEAVLLVGGMTRMPKVRDAVTAFFEQEPERGVDPDEVVALGAAIQAAVLVDESHDMVLLDVTPQTLGIMVVGGRFEALVPQNSTVPVSRSQVFTTVRDDQTTVKIVIAQGESLIAEENELLGEFALTELRAAPAGAVEIDVTFTIDADGIVSVAARDLGTGSARSLIVTASSRLTPWELENMTASAQEHALMRQRDDAFEQVREQAEALLAGLEELLPRAVAASGGGTVASQALGKARIALAHGRELIERGDTDELTRHVEVLLRTHRMFKGLIDSAG